MVLVSQIGHAFTPYKCFGFGCEQYFFIKPGGILSNVSTTQQQAGFRGLSPTVISSDSFGKDCLLYDDSSSEVQCGQRVALIGMLNM